MSWRTTAVLFVVLLLLGGYVYYQSQQEPEAPAAPTPGSPTPERVALVRDATIDDVARLDVTRLEDEARASFSRNGLGEWSQTVPTTTEVISQTMNTHITGLINLRSNRTIAPEVNPLSAYGLDAPGYEITLAVQRDGQLTRATFLIGNETPAGDAFYVLKQGDPRIYVAPKGTFENLIELLVNPPLPEATPSANFAITPV